MNLEKSLARFKELDFRARIMERAKCSSQKKKSMERLNFDLTNFFN